MQRNCLSEGGDCNLYLKVTKSWLCGSAADYRPLLARNKISSALSLLACTSNLFYEPPPVFTMSTNALVIVGFFFFKCLFVIIKMNCFTQLEMVHLRNKRVMEVDL